MKSAVVTLILLAIVGNIFSHAENRDGRNKNKLLNKKHADKDSDSSSNSHKGFEAVLNASEDNFNSAGQTSAIGKGKTAISSSIGSKGTINNLQSCKGGKAAQSFQQIANKKASSSRLRRGNNGKINRVNNASHQQYNLKGANQNAFAGAGASSSATGRKGVISNVAGADGAANADSWNKIEKKKASAAAVKNAKKLPKRHRKHDDDSHSSDKASDDSDKKSNQSNQSDKKSNQSNQSDKKSNQSNQSDKKSNQSNQSDKKSNQSNQSDKKSNQSSKSSHSHHRRNHAKADKNNKKRCN